ncbi:unnamed protein product [Nippostrongylus brasiliensis]|uniref:Secreted protein n=1 Tax=Nippostrongylus brasiliensis TaxID=27835 RepID=A0A0N4Y8L4_NIPBR|nr:unnamed protein product [Nippostrongylus brasiliensis]
MFYLAGLYRTLIGHAVPTAWTWGYTPVAKAKERVKSRAGHRDNHTTMIFPFAASLQLRPVHKRSAEPVATAPVVLASWLISCH